MSLLLILLLVLLVSISSNDSTDVYYSPLYQAQSTQQQQPPIQQQQPSPPIQSQQQPQPPITSSSSSLIIPRPELDHVNKLPYLSNPTIYNASEQLKEPIKIMSFNGKLNADLTIRSYRYDNGFIAFNTRVYCYLDYCSIPGPILLCKPGDIIEVRVTNTLDTNGDSSQYVNSTNFYIHGLHIDPNTNNFTTSNNGNGNIAIYKFKVPSDHHPGNHWYHSHKHGTSALHVMGGMVGSIIVSPLDDSDLPIEIGSMKRTNLVFSHINLDDSKTTVASADRVLDIYSYQSLSQKLKSSLPINPSFKDNTVKDLWLTNGQYQPTYTMRPEEWQVFDLLAASGDRILEIEIRTAVGASNGNYACSVTLLSIDGVYLGTTRTAKHLILIQGSRASIAVSCPVHGTYYLQTASSMDPSSPYWRIGDLDSKSSQNLLTFNVVGDDIQDGEGGSMAPPSDLSSIPKPNYLKNIPTVISATEKKWSIGLDQSQCPSSSQSPLHSKYWMGIGNDCTLACFNKTDCNRLYGATYCIQSLPSVTAKKCSYDFFGSQPGHSSFEGTTEVLSMWSWSGMSHALHMSTNHFQFLSHDDGEGTNLSTLFSLPGDWRDTWPTLKGQSLLRTYFTEFMGPRILHNNFLSYEDDGLLSSIQIIPAPPVSPNSQPETPSVSIPAVVSNEGLSTVKAVISPTEMATPLSLYYDHCDVDGKSFYYRETIDIKNRIRTIVSNSCPNHFSACQKEECSGDQSSLAKPHNVTISIPLFPEFSQDAIDTTCTTDAIAIALNGVPIKGPSDGSITCMEPLSVRNVSYGKSLCSLHGINDGIKYCGDAVQLDGSEFDKCGGHSDYDGVYHYHVAPVCLLEQMLEIKNLTNLNIQPVKSDSFVKINDFASPQIGWAYDGFPVYGPYGPYGTFMAPCNTPGANADVCLDSCNGYHGKLPGIDDFMYRYYMSGEHGEGNCSSSVANAGDCDRNTDKCCTSTVPSTVFTPYSIGCYRGCLEITGCNTSGERGYTDTYIPSIANYPKLMAEQNGYTTISIKPPVVPETVIPAAIIEPPAPAPAPTTNETLSFNVGSRLVAVRVPTNRSVILATFGKNSNGMNNMSTEEIPSSKSDTFISDMVFDKTSSTIFYASESGIYSFNTAQKNVINKLVSGVLVVEISGYNFGNSLSDIYSVTVKGDPCTSLNRLNSESIKCICVKAECNSDGVTISDVVLSTVGGSTQGIYAQPYIILKSGTGRPVVSNITLTRQPFIPNALSLVRKGSNASLYWSNIGIGSYSIQRCRLDGTQIETVGVGIQRGLGLHVIARNTNDVIFVTDGSKNALYRLVTVAMTSQIFDGSYSQVVPIITGLQTPTGVYVEDLSNNLFLTVLDGYLLKISLDVAIAIQPAPTNASYVVPGVVYTTDIDLRNGRKSLPFWAKLTIRGSSMSRYSRTLTIPSCQCNYTTCPLSWNEQRVFVADTNQQLLTLSSDYGYPVNSLNVFNAFPDMYSIVWPIALASKYDVDIPQICDEPIVLYVAEYLGKIWEITIPRNKLTGIPSLDSLPFPKLMFDQSTFVTSSKIRNILASLPIQRKVLGPQLVFEMIS